MHHCLPNGLELTGEAGWGWKEDFAGYPTAITPSQRREHRSAEQDPGGAIMLGRELTTAAWPAGQMDFITPEHPAEVGDGAGQAEAARESGQGREAGNRRRGSESTEQEWHRQRGRRKEPLSQNLTVGMSSSSGKPGGLRRKGQAEDKHIHIKKECKNIKEKESSRPSQKRSLTSENAGTRLPDCPTKG